ncbi:hypothetical protein AMAG_03733 [Allomyces macrogynus ATCC 38327]|uniref:Uncharacterized protein n=1 Tax=Allomyces macrogynus (strain ATCC 38327) TaxID=578462 RepID=A0A0L0SAP9_ALLM3|nr:hypothetical protein AMAG_03733 [Allomyces macrogynus ATCC 38327]|eukprot:KNE59455.1 hypothetical protein AMAG_03733 [Allomyces macrogynus ATCC 38327]
MPLRETSVLFDWASHRTFGPVPVNTFAALARHIEPATPGRNNLQASRRTAASPEPHATNTRSPDCGIEVVDRLPVHWYLTRTTGAATASQWAEIKLVFPALEIAEPRTASPESSDAYGAAASTAAAPVSVRFELTGHADAHFVRLTQLRRGIAGTFELVILTQDCKLVAVRFTIPHSNDLSAFKYHVAWTTIHEFLDTERFPLAVAYYRGTVFVHTEKKMTDPVKFTVQWEPTPSGKPIRGKVQYKVEAFNFSIAGRLHHYVLGHVVLSMQMLWLHGRIPYLAMLTTNELIFWDPIKYDELTKLAVPDRTVQMCIDGTFARLLLRTEGDVRPEYHLYVLGDIVESLALAVTPVGIQSSDGLPVPTPVPGADNFRVAQFVDVAWLDPDTLVAVHGSLTKTHLHVCRTGDGKNPAWTEMDQVPAPEPTALLQETLRNFCQEFGVHFDPTRELTVEGVADDYVRSETAMYPPLAASTGSPTRTPQQQQHRNRNHVSLYVSKVLGSYRKALALKRIEVPDGDVVGHNQDMVQGPLLLIKAGGYSLLRSTLPIENVVMASLSVPFQTLANVALKAARDLPLADWLLNDTMDEAALAVARAKATAAPESNQYKRIQRAIDDVRKDPRLLMRDVEHVIDMLRFHVDNDNDVSMGDLTLHMPDLVCPLLQQVLAGTQEVVAPVLALVMLFSDMFPSQVSEILAQLRHLYVLPYLLSPKVLALLPVQVDMPLARDQDVWVMHQLANLAANFESWSWEVCAKFAGLAPADAVRAIVGRPSGRSEAMAKRWFLHGMANLIHAQSHGARAADGLQALHEAVMIMRALALQTAVPTALDAVDIDMVHRTAHILESSSLHHAAITMYATELHLIEEKFAVVAHAHVDDATVAREAVHQRIDLVLDMLVACQLRVGDKAAAMSTIELVAKRTHAEHARTHALVRLWVQSMADNDVGLVKNALSDVVEDVLLAQADAAVAALQRDAAAAVAVADSSVGGSPVHSMRRIGRGAASALRVAAAPVSVARQLDQVVRVHQLLGTFYLHQRREYADAATYFYLVALYARVFAAGEDDAEVVNLRLASLLKALHSLRMIETKNKNERFVLVPGDKVPGQPDIYKMLVVTEDDLQREYDEVMLEQQLTDKAAPYLPASIAHSNSPAARAERFARAKSHGVGRVMPEDPLRLPTLIQSMARAGSKDLAREVLERHKDYIYAATQRDVEWLEGTVFAEAS